MIRSLELLLTSYIVHTFVFKWSQYVKRTFWKIKSCDKPTDYGRQERKSRLHCTAENSLPLPNF